MKLRTFTAALALIALAFTVRAAEPEHPYKNAKVNDFATHTVASKIGNLAGSGTLTQTVTEKNDKEVKLKITGTMDLGGKEKNVTKERTFDLTKPFDITKIEGLPQGIEVVMKKDQEGTEKLKVGEKTYDCTWTTYKATLKFMGQDVQGEMKSWDAKDVLGGVVKQTFTTEIAGQKVEVTRTLKEAGNKKP